MTNTFFHFRKRASVRFLTIMYLVVMGAFVVMVFGCSTGYKNDGDAVYYEYWNEGSGQHSMRLPADPKTFQVLKYDSYAKDRNSVFYKGEKVPGADASTFEALWDFYARDKNFGWYGKDTIQASHGPTLKILNAYYTTDGRDFIYRTKPLKVASPEKFKFVFGEGDYECWATDGAFYYYKNFKVPSSDYGHLTYYPNSGGISSDRQWAYFEDRKLNYDLDGKRVVDTIDISTFRVTGYLECMEKYSCFNVFHGRIKCSEQ